MERVAACRARLGLVLVLLLSSNISPSAIPAVRTQQPRLEGLQ